MHTLQHVTSVLVMSGFVSGYALIVLSWWLWSLNKSSVVCVTYCNVVVSQWAWGGLLGCHCTFTDLRQKEQKDINELYPETNKLLIVSFRVCVYGLCKKAFHTIFSIIHLRICMVASESFVLSWIKWAAVLFASGSVQCDLNLDINNERSWCKFKKEIFKIQH